MLDVTDCLRGLEVPDQPFGHAEVEQVAAPPGSYVGKG